MKKLFAISLIVMILLASCLTAQADGEWYYSYTGVVMCTNISVRKTPSTSAQRYGQLHNGDVVKIYENSNGWLTIDLGFVNMGEGVGYIKSSLVKESPCFIVLTKYTPVYADPWWTGESNGEISGGTPMLLISESRDFYCVQLHTGKAGSTFVRKSDVGRYNPECEPGYAVVMDGPIDVYDYNRTQIIGQLKTDNLVQVLSYEYEWSHIYYKSGDNYYDAWVPTSNLGAVIN